MKWHQLANILAPALAIAFPVAAPAIPAILTAINEAQAAHPDSDESREAKREHVFRAVMAGSDVATELTGKRIPPAAAVAITQAVFQSVDAIHAIGKAQGLEAAPAAASKP
jgi:hypothetical protein